MANKLNQTIDKLSQLEEFGALFHHQHNEGVLPSIDALSEIVRITRKILFPGYFGNSSIHSENVRYYIGVQVEKLMKELSEQIYAGFCFSYDDDKRRCRETAREVALRFIERLPVLRATLSTDVDAAYNGDPAAKSKSEVIFCYPAIRAISNYRIAHELLLLGVPIIPRIITEMAHSETGIDIHPGAQIGRYFTIDHGTGVVIGETSIIGENVKLYQGVTLGAKSFPLDDDGNPIKGILRHPIIEDNVVIYANSTILGRITIGKNSIIGGNIWVDKDVPADTKLIQKK